MIYVLRLIPQRKIFITLHRRFFQAYDIAELGRGNWPCYNDHKSDGYQSRDGKMGCCSGDKKCKSEKKAKRIPWFGIVLGVLAILVIVNWQA